MEALVDDIRDGRSTKVVKQFKTSIFDCAKNIKSNDETFNVTTFPEVRDQFANLMSQYVDSIQQLEAAERTFLQLSKEVIEDERDPNGGEHVNLDAFRLHFNEAFEKETTEKTTDEAEAQVELDALLYPQQEPEVAAGEDIYVEPNVQREIPKDPISKRPIKIALKSKKCNHVFDQESIKLHLAREESRKAKDRNHKIRCPVAGCTNKTMKRDELILDEETNNLIAFLQ